MESDGTDISTSSVPQEIVYIRTCADNKRVVTLMIYTHNKEVYATHVQVPMSTVPMQQVCPERAQNASDKQQTMQANLVNGLHIKSTGSHEVLHH